MGQWKTRKTPPQVIQGMTLGTLLKVLARNGYLVDPQCLGRLAHLVILGVFNSVFGAAETVFNGRKIRQQRIDDSPLFILGHWRSGTTHLQNLLSHDDNFTCPTAFQASFPHHCIYSRLGRRVFDYIAPTKRPMDNVAFAADVPHEDEFALAAESTVSPYVRVLFPVTGNSEYEALDPQVVPPEALKKWKKSLILFLKKVAYAPNVERIVLKSPPHLARVSVLTDMFPKAQFLHIVRNPYKVYLSFRQLWQNTFAYSHLQIPSQQLVENLIFSWYVEMYSVFDRDKGLIPEGALYTIKFEDLEAEPIETLRGVYEALNLPGFDAFEKKVSSYLKSIEGYRKNEYQVDEITREKVACLWWRTFEQYGYPV